MVSRQKWEAARRQMLVKEEAHMRAGDALVHHDRQFDVDFGGDEYHGHNAFIHDGDQVYRTYFINWRGDEAMGTTWSYLDMTRSDVRRHGRTRRRVTPDPAIQVVELAR
jgi:predicted dithiol-disulfide oxidoreductase (DUF899 family)